MNFELKESIQKMQKKRPKVFWAIEKWTFLRLKNVHFWISEKSFKKIKKLHFVTDLQFYGVGKFAKTEIL